MTSAMFSGALSHNRGGAVQNNFRYSIYTASIDLDDVETLDRRLRLFSLESRNLFSLRGSDYALRAEVTATSARAEVTSTSARASAPRTLKERALELLDAKGSRPLPDRIELLTQLRVFGYTFNPVSFFLGWRDDLLVSVIAEINNTHDQTFAYILDDRCRVADRDEHRASFETEKSFFVSPFIGDDCTYRWTFPASRPAAGLDELDIRMTLRRADARPFFAARLAGRRHPFDDRRLIAAFLRLPLLPAQIISRIHLQALRLRVLGLQYRRPLPEARQAAPRR